MKHSINAFHGKSKAENVQVKCQEFRCMGNDVGKQWRFCLTNTGSYMQETSEMEKGRLETLIITGHIEDKRFRGGWFFNSITILFTNLQLC